MVEPVSSLVAESRTSRVRVVSPVRLAIVTSTPQAVSHGSGTFVAGITLERALQQLGHTVRYVSPDHAPGILRHTARRFAFNLRLSPTAVADADLVIGLDMDGFTLSGWVHPFVSFVLGVLADEASFERGRVAQLLRLQANAEKRATMAAELVVTTSQYSRNRLLELYGLSADRVVVVPPPFDVERWQQDMIKGSASHSSSDRPTVFTVAHMYPRKNLSALIQAAQVLVRVMPDVSFRVAGHGPEFGNIERLIEVSGLQGNVSLLGQIPHQRLIREFSSCSVFCLPSLQEGFGIALLEAMASGKPVVACRASSTPELIEDEVNGLLAAPHDHYDLAAKLLHCLDDSELRLRMGDANQTKAREYSASKTVPRLVDFLTRI